MRPVSKWEGGRKKKQKEGQRGREKRWVGEGSSRRGREGGRSLKVTTFYDFP